MSLHEQQGFVPINGYRIWYRSVGGGDHEGIPLLLLHGGPGWPHDYLQGLEALATENRRVIFYDQLGSGRSDQPDDASLWQVERFVEELATVRHELGLGRVHLLGQSWGGMLAIEYALTHPLGLVSLILSNTASSVPMWIAELARLRAELPPEVNTTLLHHEEAGTVYTPEYHRAQMVYITRHVIRVDPVPEYVMRALAKVNHSVYAAMWGPNELKVTGALKNWDRTDRLSEIHIPTLILSGRYDEATPVLNEALYKGIAESEWVLFEKSSHSPYIEEEDLYLRTVRDFLSRVECKSQH